jgi:hypothetical protein
MGDTPQSHEYSDPRLLEEVGDFWISHHPEETRRTAIPTVVNYALDSQWQYY